MRRNCVLIMCRLSLPEDVLHVSDRLIHILLKIFDDFIEEQLKLIENRGNNNNNPPRSSDDFMIKTAMHLLNILACSVHGSDKISVGSLAIPVAMELIRTKIQWMKSDHNLNVVNSRTDDVLEITWSFLWNITGRARGTGLSIS